MQQLNITYAANHKDDSNKHIFMSYHEGAKDDSNILNIARCEELWYDDEMQQSNILYTIDCKNDGNKRTLVHHITRSNNNNG
jgi:hypothetical protein